MSSHWFKPARKLHKWLGYALALQVLAWLLGGLVMSSIPLEKVHGKHLAKRQLDNPFTMADYPAWSALPWAEFKTLEKAELSHFLSTPIIKVYQKEQGPLYFDGRTGAPFSSPVESDIRQQALAHMLDSNNAIATVTEQAKAPREAGYREHVWRVEFDDFLATTLYLDAQSGHVITVRSTLWRIFDFFWMLHIMDYDERENFNNPLLITFSATSVLFCLSGFFLLFQSPPWRRRTTAR